MAHLEKLRFRLFRGLLLGVLATEIFHAASGTDKSPIVAGNTPVVGAQDQIAGQGIEHGKYQLNTHSGLPYMRTSAASPVDEPQPAPSTAVINSFWMYAVSCLAACVAALLACISVFFHLAEYHNPQLQGYVVRILCFVPVYGGALFVALSFPAYGVYVEAARYFYESLTVYSMYLLLIERCGGREECMMALSRDLPVCRTKRKMPCWWKRQRRALSNFFSKILYFITRNPCFNSEYSENERNATAAAILFPPHGLRGRFSLSTASGTGGATAENGEGERPYGCDETSTVDNRSVISSVHVMRNSRSNSDPNTRVARDRSPTAFSEVSIQEIEVREVNALDAEEAAAVVAQEGEQHRAGALETGEKEEVAADQQEVAESAKENKNVVSYVYNLVKTFLSENILLSRETMDSDYIFLRCCKRWIMQFVVLKPIIGLIVVALYIGGWTDYLAFKIPYFVLMNMSVLAVLYAFMRLVSATCQLPDMRSFNPIPKVIMLQLMVAITWYQSFIFNCFWELTDDNFIKWSNWLLCTELPLFALFNSYAYPVKEFFEPSSIPDTIIDAPIDTSLGCPHARAIAAAAVAAQQRQRYSNSGRGGPYRSSDGSTNTYVGVTYIQRDTPFVTRVAAAAAAAPPAYQGQGRCIHLLGAVIDEPPRCCALAAANARPTVQVIPVLAQAAARANMAAAQENAHAAATAQRVQEARRHISGPQALPAGNHPCQLHALKSQTNCPPASCIGRPAQFGNDDYSVGIDKDREIPAEAAAPKEIIQHNCEKLCERLTPERGSSAETSINSSDNLFFSFSDETEALPDDTEEAKNDEFPSNEKAFPQ